MPPLVKDISVYERDSDMDSGLQLWSGNHNVLDLCLRRGLHVRKHYCSVDDQFSIQATIVHLQERMDSSFINRMFIFSHWHRSLRKSVLILSRVASSHMPRMSGATSDILSPQNNNEVAQEESDVLYSLQDCANVVTFFNSITNHRLSPSCDRSQSPYIFLYFQFNLNFRTCV